MITEAILNVFLSIVEFLLKLLPEISWDVNNNVFTNFFEILRLACYMLPMGTISILLFLTWNMMLARVFFAVIHFIKSMLSI